MNNSANNSWLLTKPRLYVTFTANSLWVAYQNKKCRVQLEQNLTSGHLKSNTCMSIYNVQPYFSQQCQLIMNNHKKYQRTTQNLTYVILERVSQQKLTLLVFSLVGHFHSSCLLCKRRKERVCSTMLPIAARNWLTQ